MIFRIWFNKNAKPAEAWVVQQQKTKDYPGRDFLAPAVEVRGVTRFVEAAPGQTPGGWAEADGAISVDGSTNLLTIRTEQ